MLKEYSLPGRGGGRDLSRYGKKPTEQGALTAWTRQREELVRTPKKTNGARGTHVLETAEGETGQDTGKNPTERGPRSTHQLETAETGTCQDTERPTERGALTSWRRQSESLVRTRERIQPNEGHSLPGDDRGGVLSA